MLAPFKFIYAVFITMILYPIFVVGGIVVFEIVVVAMIFLTLKELLTFLFSLIESL